MKIYTQMTVAELQEEYAAVKRKYENCKAKGLKLDMSRGKPGKEQLDLSEGMLTCLTSNEQCICDGVDVRNYGLLDGLPSARHFFAELLEVSDDMVLVGGNASLTLMYDTIARCYVEGVADGATPWGKQGKIKFLCPAPGYDRHFAITEHFGFELILINMTDDGPDMDAVEEAVKDPAVKGIWCVPKYSNPGGVVYSDEAVERLAALKPAADDFRIFYDNAYVIHHLTDEEPHLAEIFSLARKYGNEDMIYEFASTSKCAYPGAGISCLVASKENLDFIKKSMFYQTIGPDKVNELRHILYFKNADGVKAHMKRHAAVLRPRFEIVTGTLKKALAPCGIGEWKEPLGGYFVSFDTPDGCARRTLALAAEAGVKMTGAGATFPYHLDPRDRNIRIAPSYPSCEELQAAMDIFCLCVKLAYLEQVIGERNE